MKIVIDDKIPYIRGAFEPFAEVVYLPGNKTTAEVVKMPMRWLPAPVPAAIKNCWKDQRFEISLPLPP
jgi:hypothetical protein